MKKIQTLLFLLVQVATSFAQIVDGNYKCDRQSFTIQGQTIEYYMEIGCCVVSAFKGKGNFNVLNKKLFISPYLPVLANTVRSFPSSNSDSMLIHVEGPDSIGVSINVFQKNKLASLTGTNLKGEGIIDRKMLANADSLLLLSHESRMVLKLDKSHLLDYIVRLYPDNESHRSFISNKNSGFEIKMKRDVIYLKFADYANHNKYPVWHKFEKQK